MKKYTSLMHVLTFTFFVCLPMIASASAFQVNFQSVNSLGYAHADMAAQAEDASTAYYNPAGMTHIKEGQIEIGMVGYQLKGQYRNKLKPEIPAIVEETLIESLETILGPLPLTSLDLYLPRANNNSFDSIPNLHIVQPIPCAPWDLTLGFSVVAPWALETDYNNALVTTLYADKTRIESIQINPSIAIKPFAGLSIGAGYSVEQVKTYYSTSILVLGVESKLSGWKSTWNVGAMYEFNDDTRIGLTYRPKVVYHQTGKTKLLTAKVRAKSEFTTPGCLGFGLYHRLNCRASLMATATYTFWDKVRTVTVNSEIPAISVAGFNLDFSSISVPLNWKNTWFIGVGGDYRVNEQWTLKGGLAYDMTPTRSKYRELRVPDQDRYHFAVGARYSFNENLMFDIAYEYIYTPLTQIKNSPALPINILEQNGIPGNIYTSGHSQAHATIFGGELTWKW